MKMKPAPRPLEVWFAEYAAMFSARKDLELRRKIALFVEVSNQTANRWFRGALQPVGGNKWKSIAFFHLLDYPVVEFEALSSLLQDAVLHYALQVTTPEALFAAFHYTDSKEPASRLFDTFNTNMELSKARQQSVAAFLDAHHEDLEAAKELFAESYRAVRVPLIAVGDTVIPVPVPAPAPALVAVSDEAISPPLQQKSSSAKPAILESLAAMVTATLPLAKMVASNTFTPEDRAALRELAGGDGIFRLSNLLEQLCSESARNGKGVQR